MPIYADFDRDGLISRSTSELRAAQERPGVVILPNLDADSAYAGAAGLRQGRVPLDRDLRLVGPSEDDLTEIQVMAQSGAAACVLSLRQQDMRLVRVYDAAGQIVLGEGAVNPDNFLHVIAASTTPQRFFIEGISLPGYPDSEDYPLYGTVYFTLTSIDATGMPFGEVEHAYATVAPFLLMHNNDEALVMYMCEETSNEASRYDIYEAFGIEWQGSGLSSSVQRIRGSRIACTLAIVPQNAHMSDKWMQDQFEVGYFRGNNRDLPAILHLPRLRQNFALLRQGVNLGGWVAQYFSRPGMALIQNLWRPQLQVYNEAGEVQLISYEGVMEIEFLIGRLRTSYNALRRLERVAHLEVTQLEGEERSGLLADEGVMLQALLLRAQTALSTEGNRQPGENQQGFEQMLALLQEDLEEIWDDISSSFELIPEVAHTTAQAPEYVIIHTESAGDLRFAARTEGQRVMAGSRTTSYDFGGSIGTGAPVEEFKELTSRVEQLVGSHNYGGNIEIAPPTIAHPFGQIFVGSPELGHPELWRFLSNQGYQKLVSANTAWLTVGHIDEILSFAPVAADGLANAPFAALRASAGLALDMLIAARDLHLQGFPSNADDMRFNDETERPLNFAHIRTDAGSHPVTRMLRGKRWLRTQGEVRPAELYMELRRIHSMRLGSRAISRTESGGIRSFDAAIGIREALHIAHEFNRNVEADFLGTRTMSEWLNEEFLDNEQQAQENPPPPLQEILEENLTSIPIVPIPVLFDLPIFSGQTVAFLPDMVNMQHVDGHALVPRPYGPRMSPDDAAQVIRPFLPPSVQAFAGRSYFIRHRLNQTIHWAESRSNLALNEDDLTDIVRMFRDGFPEDMEEAEIGRRIRNHPANRRAFRREVVWIGDNRITRWLLKERLHKLVIPENTVDLFEAYAYIILKEFCGLEPHFIDSWSYHLTLGEIHCGTNIVRRPPRRPNWWDMRRNIPEEPFPVPEELFPRSAAPL